MDGNDTERMLDPTLASGDADPTETQVRMSDGVRLATDVYIPAGGKGRTRWPTALARLPYGKRGLVAFMPAIAAYLLDRGYAVVVQDVRGKFGSEGAQEPFVHEVRDGYDTLEWIAAQPWSNGHIGMFGDSYYGYTQWAAAASGHPSLRAIVPRVTSTRLTDDWFFQDGVFNMETMVDWAAQTWVAQGLCTYDRDWSIRPLYDLLPAWLDGARSGALDQWMRSPYSSAYWAGLRRNAPDPAAVDIPVLHLGGWWDVFRRGQFRDWRRAMARGRDHRLSVSAVDHLGLVLPDEGHGPADNWMASPSRVVAHVPDYIAETAAFFDQHLRGLGGAQHSPVAYEISGLGRFERAQWPPPETVTTSLHPAGSRDMSGPEGGLLLENASARTQTVRWNHDPRRPVPSLDADPWGVLYELPDERAVECRDDVVTFTTDAQLEDLVLLGPAHVYVAVSATASPFEIVAKLVHVHPDGFARRIAVGVTQSGGEVAEVDLGDLAYRVPRGEHLRLELAATSFPRYLPMTAGGQNPWLDPVPSHELEYQVRVGRGTGTHVRLTTLPSAP